MQPPHRAASRDLIVRDATHTALARLPEEVPALFWIEQAAVFRRRWRVLAISVSAGVAIALLLSAVQPTLYHATTSIEIQPVAEQVVKSASNKDVQPPDIQTQIKIIGSAAVLGRAEARLHLKSTSEVAKSLSVHTAGQTRIIEVEADARDPQAASDFVNTVAQEYIARHLEAGEQDNGLLEARSRRATEELRNRLETADGALQSYARESGIILTKDDSSVTEERLRQVQDWLSRAQAERVQKQARADAVSQNAGPNQASVLDDPAIKNGQEKLADLRRERAELSVTYTPDYPKVQRLDAEIESVNAAVQQQIVAASGRIRSAYQEARSSEAMLGESYQAQRAAVLEEGEKRVHYAVLKAEADSTRSLYNSMLERVKESGISAAMHATNVRVLDAAAPASDPFQPRRAQSLLLGALAGMLIGLFLAHNIDESDRVVKKPGEVAQLLDAVELGSVPRLSEMPSSETQSNDAYRAIVASVLLAPDAAEQRALVVTSALPGEGKTTVTAGLGAALARAGKRVLVIDGDVLQPDLTARLDVSTRLGFGDLLGSNRRLDVIAIAPAITPTGDPRLHVLTMGLLEQYSPDLLHAAALNEILAYSRKNFDIVLIDTPPVLKSPDARVIARAADAAILVVRAGHATREAAWAARQAFAEDGTPMAGIILNDWNPNTEAARYGQASPAVRRRERLAAKRASA